AGSPNPPPDSEENGAITLVSQIWVAPFVQTLWDQSSDVSGNYACYNYYTPPGPNGDVNNDVCGCVATCMAQLMYYFQYPTTGVGTNSFSITNNGTTEMTSLLGGNGSGGAYVWSSMPLSPNQPTTAQAIAIGALTHDAGATVHMYYTPSSGSSAYTYLAQQALTSTFKFSNAGYYENDGSGISGSNLLNMINPNVDARLPVALGISGNVGGHCVLVDGYGYSASTLFHHVNAGWGGDDDIWYALPGIDTPDNGDYTIVQAGIYNIYTNGSGQIISGRVTDPTGAPVAGATVTAVRTGGGTYAAATDTNGIYALPNIPAASSYTLTTTKSGNASATNHYSTGTSVYNELPSGNVWGANFVLSPPLLVTSETGFAAIGPTNGPFNVFSQTCTLTNTSASPINWMLSNTNNWLSVTATSGALAAGAAFNLTITLSSAANSLAAGNYTGYIWITNLNNGLAQQFQFSIVVATADYPIALTGFNMDVVVENTAVGGNTYNYADTFDPDSLLCGCPTCFYEAGLVASNLYGGASVLGLPTSGLLTSEFDHATTFQFAPNGSSNVLYLTSASNSASLAFNTPMACKSLSVLAASAQGGGNGTLVVHFADGTASSAISFNAPNYMTTNTAGSGAAITNFGILEVGGPFNQYYSLDYYYWFPSLYQTSINLKSLGLNAKPITSVTFTMPSGAGTTSSTVTGVFALSGTEAPLTNSPASFVTSAGSPSLSGGRFTMELTNLIGQGPVIISASTNLSQWLNIYTNPSSYGTAFITDSNAGSFPRRFYHAATP
ncbi:MAG: C10 family peptidase, partial [Limisphaerales bacterium]